MYDISLDFNLVLPSSSSLDGSSSVNFLAKNLYWAHNSSDMFLISLMNLQINLVGSAVIWLSFAQFSYEPRYNILINKFLAWSLLML